LPPGRALDLACGTGRNALWLAAHGWRVAAVDGSPVAIETLRKEARARRLKMETHVANLESDEFKIEERAWSLIALCYYLQRRLFEPAKRGVMPGGILLAIVHIIAPGEEPTATRAHPGELAAYFRDWQILHSFEGNPADSAHKHPVAEIVARRRPDASGLR
jgi:tellurite methyltransferase